MKSLTTETETSSPLTGGVSAPLPGFGLGDANRTLAVSRVGAKRLAAKFLVLTLEELNQLMDAARREASAAERTAMQFEVVEANWPNGIPDDAPIADIELSVRSIAVLKRNGLLTAGEVRSRSKDDLRRMGLTSRCLREVIEVFGERG